MRNGLKYYFKEIYCWWHGHDYHTVSDLPVLGKLVECKRCKRIKRV